MICSTFSRQACAERVEIRPDGSIGQVECTSMGLSAGPLPAEGEYPAPVCCILTNGHMPHCTNTILTDDIPYITHGGGERYITGIQEGVRIGYKYFAFDGETRLTLRTRGHAAGHFDVTNDEGVLAVIPIESSDDWAESRGNFFFRGTGPLYLDYHGDGNVELLSLSFESAD